jgi:hypothetical protein
MAVQRASQRALNLPAQSGVAGQGGDVEPNELDEAGSGWGERGQAFHDRGKTGFTVSPLLPPSQHTLLANREQLWIIKIVHPRQLLAQVLTQAPSKRNTGFADTANRIAVLGVDGPQIDHRSSGGDRLEDGGGRVGRELGEGLRELQPHSGGHVAHAPDVLAPPLPIVLLNLPSLLGCAMQDLRRLLVIFVRQRSMALFERFTARLWSSQIVCSQAVDRAGTAHGTTRLRGSVVSGSAGV